MLIIHFPPKLSTLVIFSPHNVGIKILYYKMYLKIVVATVMHEYYFYYTSIQNKWNKSGISDISYFSTAL